MVSQRLKALSAKLLGNAGESRAQTFLEQQGLSWIANNYRSRFGEIDLIMQDGNTVVFVEVRVRSSQQFGGAAESVDYRKQQKIIKTAAAYLQQFSPPGFSRFDVIAIEGTKEINWIKSAFDAS